MLPAILLVDDEEEILEFLERMLRNKYAIFKAENGQEALNILANEVVQLVVSDVMMPQMDGFELCRIIKSNFEFSQMVLL